MVDDRVWNEPLSAASEHTRSVQEPLIKLGSSLTHWLQDHIRRLGQVTRQKPLFLGTGAVLVFVLGYLLLKGGAGSQLIGFFAYMSVACTLIPLPTPPVVMALGEMFHPFIVGSLGAFGNCLAALAEYKIVLWGCSKTELEQKLVKSRIFRRFAHYFQKAAFGCIVFTGFTPVPFEPFRYAAILTRYPLWKYLLAIFIGRFPRYYLMAWCGDQLNIPTAWLVLMLVALFGIPTLTAVIVGRFKALPENANQDA